MVASHRVKPRQRHRPLDTDGTVQINLAGDGPQAERGRAGGRMYLAVDNTRSGLATQSVAAVTVADPDWSEAIGHVVDRIDRAVQTLRLEFANRLGRFGMTADVLRMIPVVAVATVFVFGSLFAVRLAQGEPGTADVAGRHPAVDQAAQLPASAISSEVIVVMAGDSLWSIATDRFPNEDPRRVVDLFVEANGGSMIQAGQHLSVPVELSTQHLAQG